GGVYLQITRGVARRDHPFPKGSKPVLSMTVCAAKLPKATEVEKGVSVIIRPDIRWGRCDVKSIALLPNLLAKQEASSAGAREAWLHRPDGEITEGSVSNAYIVAEKEEVITHPADHRILGGVTRDVVLALARKDGIGVSERPFTLAEACAAREAFITSTSANVLPVTRIDGASVGGGAPGAVTRRLLALYHAHILAQTGRRFA
ncbi:MAG: aminotransferase class IV, partial [Alphaproteobacteria bacterium]|nr:aminotransferase class IV [Alphaproteobacteria bacterium]